MKKFILPLIVFALVLFLPPNSFAQSSTDCWSKHMIKQYSVCSPPHTKCLQECSVLDTTPQRKVCFEECGRVNKLCTDKAVADYKACVAAQNQQSSPAPTAEPSATPYNGPLIKVPFTVPGWLNIIDWTKKAKFVMFLVKKGDFFTLLGSSQDHSLCDPEDCERTTPEGDEKYLEELYERRLREFNGFIDRDNEPWPFLKDVEIGDDGKPVLIKTPQGAFEIQPFNNQKAKLEYKGNIPVLKGGQLEVFEENKGPTPTTIETPNAEIFIIGTHFLLTYDQKGKYTALAVFDGRVEIKPKGSSASKVVSPNEDKPGQMFVITKTSVVRLVMFWLVLAAVIGGIFLIVRRKFASKGFGKKKR